MKKLICTLLAVCLFAAWIPAAYADGEDTYMIGGLEVPYYDDGAQRLEALGLFEGTGDGYALSQSVTRAEAVLMALRMVGEEQDIPDTYERHFSDMSGHWAEAAAEYAYSRGYINGTGESEFTPERSVTGREFVKMLLGAFGYTELTLENAYDTAVDSEILQNNYTRTAVRTDGYELKRSDVVRICLGALHGKLADGRRLNELLTERGVFTRQQFTRVMGSATPASRDNRDFAWNLNSEMPSDKNYMFSPLSIKAALAMAANGAEGETQREILDALGIDDLEVFNESMRALISEYAQSGEVALSVSNSIWLNKDYPGAAQAEFNREFLSVIENSYFGEAKTVGNSDAAETINAWVSENTNGRIPNIISDCDFLAALINAVYFKGEWLTQFNSSYNDFKTFKGRDGSEEKIEFMNKTGYYQYFENGYVRMIAIPYKDTDVSMYIALPQSRAVDLDIYIPEMKSTYISLSIPKFRIEFETELGDMLKELGIETAFSEARADFGGMVDNYPMNVFIDKVVHKTYIDVDENGTEAAAATGVMAGGTAMPPEPIEFTADEPFTYFIYDRANDEILFIGEYAYAE